MLTDYKIKSMEKKEKAYRVADNEGLVLEVRVNQHPNLTRCQR